MLALIAFLVLAVEGKEILNSNWDLQLENHPNGFIIGKKFGFSTRVLEIIQEADFFGECQYQKFRSATSYMENGPFGCVSAPTKKSCEGESEYFKILKAISPHFANSQIKGFQTCCVFDTKFKRCIHNNILRWAEPEPTENRLHAGQRFIFDDNKIRSMLYPNLYLKLNEEKNVFELSKFTAGEEPNFKCVFQRYFLNL